MPVYSTACHGLAGYQVDRILYSPPAILHVSYTQARPNRLSVRAALGSAFGYKKAPIKTRKRDSHATQARFQRGQLRSTVSALRETAGRGPLAASRRDQRRVHVHLSEVQEGDRCRRTKGGVDQLAWHGCPRRAPWGKQNQRPGPRHGGCRLIVPESKSRIPGRAGSNESSLARRRFYRAFVPNVTRNPAMSAKSASPS